MQDAARHVGSPVTQRTPVLGEGRAVDDGGHAIRRSFRRAGGDDRELAWFGNDGHRSGGHGAGTAEAVRDADVSAGLIRATRTCGAHTGGCVCTRAHRIAGGIGQIGADHGHQQTGDDPQQATTYAVGRPGRHVRQDSTSPP